jgi:CDP-glycerol glycerophosphotransferase
VSLLSVVVPVYKVQGYLRACLDSILDQAPDDLELVAVDDRSPDGSGDILAEYAARDPRVRVLSLPANVGLGHARNAGLAAATGEYVWFVDSDDWLADGAVPAVVERLRSARPDVLVFDHRRVFWDDGTAPRHQPPEFADTPHAGGVRDTPWLLRMSHVAWNKVLRREFLREHGLTFEAGWYEDVSFTYPALVAARRISVLDRVCVNYRQRRVGAITRTVDDRHFEVFTHWERVFALLEKFGPAVDDLRPAVFARMVWHYLVVMSNVDRLPRRSRRAFFDRAAADFARYRPAGGYPVPGGVAGVKHRLLARRDWTTFALLWASVRAQRRASALPGRAARSARRAGRAVRALLRGGRQPLGRAYYGLVRRFRPLDPGLAVYAAYWYRGYACNPAAVYEAARTLAPDVRGVWVVRRDLVDRMPAGVPYVVAGSLAYYRALARATYLVNNVNFPDFVVKRPGSVHLQTHHGAPVKVMGIEQARFAGGDRMDYAALLRRCDRWDFSVTSNSLSTEVWDRAYPCAYETLEYGYPRNDRLIRAGAPEVAAARSAVGAGPDDVVLLYAPTHRTHDPAYRPPFDAAAVVSALGPGGLVLMRSHYFEPGKLAGGAGPRVLDVSGAARIEDLYLAADVLVTDYSSAMFDYGVLDRPIVVYAPDWPEYRAVRGVTFDVTAFPPGAVARTFEELVALLRTGAHAGEPAGAARAAFRERFCAWDDGHAAERVVRRVFLGEPVPGRRRPALPAILRMSGADVPSCPIPTATS